MSIFDPIARAFWRNKYLDADAYAEGVESGKAQGRKEAHDKFWSDYSKNNFCDYRFAGVGWNDETFKPANKDIRPTSARYMFAGSHISDYTKNANIDFSQCASFESMVFESKLIKVGVIDTRASIGFGSLFNGATFLETVEELIFKDDGSQTMSSNTFRSTTSLANIKISGIIGNDINMQYSPLTVDSMKSVISHLANFNGTDKNYTRTITFSDACWKVLEDSGPAPDGSTWGEYVESLGWLI